MYQRELLPGLDRQVSLGYNTTPRHSLGQWDDGEGAWKGAIVVSLVKAERAEADSMESATLMAMPARGSLDPDTAGPWRRASSREAGAMVLDDHREQRRG